MSAAGIVTTQPRQYRVSLARTVFADIQVEATSPAAARELAMRRLDDARRKFVAEAYVYRTEIIDGVIDGKPVWIEAS